jgi:hypothetical protein
VRIRANAFGVALVFLFCFSPRARAYSVLTHEALVDSLWHDAFVPTLKARFPAATEADLKEAHAYAYGGCIIQDLGYYPFGSRFYSDLTHYVRSADFVQALVDDAQNLDEFAFAMGAVAHYGADVDGHRIAVNRAVPILYPKLRAKYGDEVTYGDNPHAHMKTEFGFDVLQVARGNYAAEAYHDFIGFHVAKDLLDRAFQETYGLKLKDLFGSLDLALGTYRFSVSSLIPNATKAAWVVKKDEIQKLAPGVTRQHFLYNIRRADYTKEWGADYRRPGIFARFLALLMRVLPKIGPLRGLEFRVPTPEAEKMFEASFDAAVKLDRQSFAEIRARALKLSNLDLDTGMPVSPGEYALTDQTYDQLLKKLGEKKFADVSADLRADILKFYGEMKGPDPHGIDGELGALTRISHTKSLRRPKPCQAGTRGQPGDI